MLIILRASYRRLSQTTVEGDNVDYDSESDAVSVGETPSSNRNTDLYSLEDMNPFLDETFKKSVKVSCGLTESGRKICGLTETAGWICWMRKNGSALKSTLPH